MVNILSGIALTICVVVWIAMLRYNAWLHKEDEE